MTTLLLNNNIRIANYINIYNRNIGLKKEKKFESNDSVFLVSRHTNAVHRLCFNIADLDPTSTTNLLQIDISFTGTKKIN